MDCTIFVAKTMALISCAFTVQLICTFVFTYSVPIHVELRVNHAEIILITHKFWVEDVHSRTHFSLKNVEHHHFSSFNCESTRPNDFCSQEESQKSLF